MPQSPLRLLLVEPSFPGRLGPVADWLVERRGCRAWFFAHTLEPEDRWPGSVGRGLDLIRFDVGGVAREPAVAWTRHLERGLCYAYGAWEVFDARRLRPIDVALGRSSGLGSTLFVPVSYPGLPIVNLFDQYLHPTRHDLADEDAPVLPEEYAHWRRAANAMDLLDLENGVAPWAPTAWQRDLYPAEYRDDFTVLFDGVDSRGLARRGPRPDLIAGRVLPPGAKVVTFVARTPDRLRGFDRFIALADRLLRERPDVVCVVLGGGPVGRMLDLRGYGRDFVAETLAARPVADPSRLWLLGPSPPSVVAEALRASDLHVAPGRPHPVAKSLVEAMAAGCVVLAWDSPPVREFVEDGRSGLLAPPDDPEAAAALALAALDDPAAHRPLGDAAAELVRGRHDRDVTLPRLAEWLDRLASSR
jgi:glycosyltransferase involved in cell wall biosynthesis